MSAQVRTRPTKISAAAALLSLGLHVGFLGAALQVARLPSPSAAARTSDEPVSLPVDLAGPDEQATSVSSSENLVDVALAGEEPTPASPPEAPEPAPEALVEPRLIAPAPKTAKALAAAPRTKATEKAAKSQPERTPPAKVAAEAEEGEDWLGINAQREPDVRQPAQSPPAKSHHDELVERLLAAEKRKADARAAVDAQHSARTPASTAPSPKPAPTAPGTPAAAETATTPTARKLQAANSLSQAAAWTIPYACATDPVWERESSRGGRVDLRVQLVGGRVTQTELDGEVPLHLKKLADGVSFYLKQGYRGGDGLARDGAYLLQIAVRTSEGPKNQSLGFDPDRARSHFTLVTGRRVDADVSERPYTPR